MRLDRLEHPQPCQSCACAAEHCLLSGSVFKGSAADLCLLLGFLCSKGAMHNFACCQGFCAQEERCTTLPFARVSVLKGSAAQLCLLLGSLCSKVSAADLCLLLSSVQHMCSKGELHRSLDNRSPPRQSIGSQVVVSQAVSQVVSQVTSHLVSQVVSQVNLASTARRAVQLRLLHIWQLQGCACACACVCVCVLQGAWS